MLRRISDFLYQPLSSYSAYSIAFVIGVFFVFLVYPIHFLLGDAVYFISRDPAQHVSGWWFYKNDAWHFPILKTIRLNYPQGTALIFTDSIALVALILKPFANWLPEHFHYIGLWHGFSFTFQAIAATYLIRTMQQNSLLALIAALILTLTFPPLLMRMAHMSMGHTSLLTQGVLLLGIAFYWQGSVINYAFKNITRKFIVLVLITLLVHPYFTAMILALWLGVCIDEYRKNKNLSIIVYSTLILFAFILIEMYITGYFISSNSFTAAGYEHHSMNLLAPFAPICDDWFTTFCFQAGTTGQYEGFNFLGIGAWIIIIASLLLSWQDWKTYKSLRGLQITLVLLTFFALSGKIYIASYLFLDFPMTTTLGELFQVGGRFFWPVGYSFIFLSLLVLLKYKNRLIITLIITIALCLQLFQFSTYYKMIQKHVQPINTHELPYITLFKNFEAVNVYPIYGCVYPYPYDFLRIQYQAANAGILINAGYLARHIIKCEEKELIFYQSLESNHLYLALTQDNLPPVLIEAIQKNECVKSDDLLFCAKGKTFDWWQQNSGSLEFTPAIPQ